MKYLEINWKDGTTSVMEVSSYDFSDGWLVLYVDSASGNQYIPLGYMANINELP